MLELSKVQHLAETYAPQELFAALVWQRQFNLFDGPQVITDSANHPDLWESFLFTKPVFAPDKHGLSFNGLVDTLLAMANYRPMPSSLTRIEMRSLSPTGGISHSLQQRSGQKSGSPNMIGTALSTKAIHTSMVDSSAIQAYLKGIGRRYELWRRDNALTDIIAAQQATFTFEQFVQTEDKQPREQPQKKTLPLFKGIRDYLGAEHVLLVGSPGVGKSSALWHCLDAFAKEELELSQPRIPVLVQLKGYQDSFVSSEDPSGLLALIQDSIRPYLRLSIPEVYDLLCHKQLILLIDGLNEMPAGAFRTHLKAFREECQELEIPLICSTRELGGGDLGIQCKLEIQPLSSKETKRFLQECLPDHQDQVRQLLQRDNRELSRTPFVLWMLYHLLEETGTIAETLGESFRQFFRFHFRKYKEDAPVSEERRKSWNLWMEHLAFSMLSSLDPLDPSLIIEREAAENVLSERFGKLNGASSRIHELEKYHLLEQVSERQISFQHQLIQEYYAAEEMLRRLLEKHFDLVNDQRFKCLYLNFMKWTESLAIVTALLNSEVHAIRIVQLAIEVDLFLASRLSEDLQPIFRDKGSRLLAAQEMPNWVRSELTISSTNFNRLNSTPMGKLSHRSFFREEWEEFLPSLLKLLQKGETILLKELPHTREIAAMALAQAEYTVAIPSLIQALKSDDVQLRWSIPYALGLLGVEDSIPGLLESLESKKFYIRWSAADVLEQIGSVQAIPGLLKALENQDSYIQERAADGLKRFQGDLAAHTLPRLYQMILVASERNARRAFIVFRIIQSKCQFYNYKIYVKAHELESAEALDSSLLNKIDEATQRMLKMVSEPKNDFRGANFNAPVNFGDNPTGDFISTQNNYANDPEVQDAISDLKTLLTQLQAQHPSISTEGEALAIIDAEFTEIQQSQSHKLATLQKQLLNPERHLQAAKAAAVEVAKHYLEDSVLAKAVITYFDKLSEEPNYGA